MALTYDTLQNDTIAAIATGITESGIGIIRISADRTPLQWETVFAGGGTEAMFFPHGNRAPSISV